ncbi:MAG: hypothetical protein ACRDZ3_21325 [Acidimicrobiia bacterium]
MRSAPSCPGCGRRVPRTIATCLACGAEAGDRLIPISVGHHGTATAVASPAMTMTSPGVPSGSRRRPAVIIVSGLAVMAALNLLPSAEDPTAPVAPPAEAGEADAPLASAHPPAAGVLARADEASRTPGVVWPLPGPLRDRLEYTTVWTGTHMMMWRGPETGRALDGSAYDTVARAWRATTPAPIESRSHAAAIWTGREVLVWGGLSATGVPFADGAAYDPAGDAWRAISVSPLGPRVPLVAAWTGREVLVVGARTDTGRARWGGGGSDAAAYDPAADRWRSLPMMPVALGEGVAAWTGSELIVYGGLAAPQGKSDPASGSRRARGTAYDPAQDRWRLLPVAPLTSPFLTAAWTGREFVAWDDGKRAASFNPRSGKWSRVGGFPTRR